MDFRFSRSNIRYARNDLGGGILLIFFVVIGTFGRNRSPSALELWLFSAVTLGAFGFWYLRGRRVQSSMDGLVATTLSVTSEGLMFIAPSEMDNVSHHKLKLKFSDMAAFRVDRPKGPLTVVLRLKNGQLFVLPCLEDRSSFTQELRKHLPEEKRSGPFGMGREWRQV